jgi:hypothetical protein
VVFSQHSPLDRLTPTTQKKLNNKQGTEREHVAETAGCSECTGEGGRRKELITIQAFSKQSLERQTGQQRAGDKPLHQRIGEGQGPDLHSNFQKTKTGKADGPREGT